MDILLRGSVIKMRHRDLSSPEPHFFIVLDIDDSLNEGEVLLLCVSTSKVEKTQKIIHNMALPPTTFVEIGPLDCDVLTKSKSCINCNSVFTASIKDFKSQAVKMISGKNTSSISFEKLNEIITGVCDSPRVKEKYKKRVRGKS